MANLKSAGYKEKFLEIRKDSKIVEFTQQSRLKKNNCFKVTSCGTYSKKTSYGNSWEMYKVIPIDEKGAAIKLKLAGSYFLIGFFHNPDINFYEDTSYVIVEYAKTGKRFKLGSMLNTDFELGQIQRKLKTKSIEDFVGGSWSRLSDDLAEKLDRLRCFFNKNLNPDKLLLEKKIELVEKHLFKGNIRRKLKIETGKRKEIIIRY